MSVGKRQAQGRRALYWSVLIFTAVPPVSAAADAQPVPSRSTLITPEAARADLEALYSGLERAHFDLYARASRSAYDRFYRSTRRALDRPLTRVEFVRRLQRFAAFGRIAHARIDEVYGLYRAHLDGGGKAFPLQTRIINGAVYVSADRSGGGNIRRGDRLLAIDGVEVEEWLKRCAGNLSADNRYMAEALMELDLPMLLWLEQGERQSYAVTVSRGARRLDVTLRARTHAELTGTKIEPSLDLAASDRSWRMLGSAVGYLRPGGFYNTDPEARDMYDNRGFRTFIDTAFEGLNAAGARAVIIDLRDNPGGDSSFSDLMVSWFADRPYSFTSGFHVKVSPETVTSNAERLSSSPPDSISHQFASLYAGARTGDVVQFKPASAQPRKEQRFKGRVFVLVNRNTYSNAVAVAATVQDYGFGVILGEETSDLATTYGAMESFKLPRSEIRVNYPKALIVRPNGDLAARGVRPDVTIATPIVEAPEDEVLARALEHVQQRLRIEPT